MTGFIYFLQVGMDGPIKIGFTNSNVRQRARTLQAISPHVLRWIGVFPGTKTDERNAHLLLKNCSVRGEWFYPTVEVMAFIPQKSPDFEPFTVDNPLVGRTKRSDETRAKQSASLKKSWATRRALGRVKQR